MKELAQVEATQVLKWKWKCVKLYDNAFFIFINLTMRAQVFFGTDPC